MEIANMTPHAITVENNGTSKVYEPSGTIARVEMKSETVGLIDGFPIVKNKVVGHNVPEQQDSTYYIVSAMVLGLLPERKDLLAPNTGQAKRNESGHIVSVPGFVSN